VHEFQQLRTYGLSSVRGALAWEKFFHGGSLVDWIFPGRESVVAKFLFTVATSPLALSVRFTTNGMCVKNNTHIYTWREQAIRMIVACSQCEALPASRSGFPIATLPTPKGKNIFLLTSCGNRKSPNVKIQGTTEPLPGAQRG